MLFIAVAALGLAACGGEDSGTDSGIDVENASAHEPASATTSYRLACTDASEPANFAYFSLGPKFQGEGARDVLRNCIASATEHRTEPNDVAFLYGTCKSEGDTGCAPPFQISSSPACQLNYTDYRPPRGVSHRHSPLKQWGSGAISVEFFDLGKVDVFTGESTIEMSRGEGSKAGWFADALASVRMEPGGKPLGKPASKAAGPVGIESLPAPAPGAMQGKLGCNA